MTNQEIFDKGLFHCRKQGHAAVDGAGNCQYLAPNGDMCIVGCMISPDAYDPRIEGYNLENSTEALNVAIAASGFTADQFPLLIDLQGAHDQYLTNSMQYFNAQMRRISRKYSLEYTTVRASRKQAS